jgi:hypothetical protein
MICEPSSDRWLRASRSLFLETIHLRQFSMTSTATRRYASLAKRFERGRLGREGDLQEGDLEERETRERETRERFGRASKAFGNEVTSEVRRITAARIKYFVVICQSEHTVDMRMIGIQMLK